MSGYFITATGTDAGKTLFTAALLWQLTQAGREARAVKPVASGFDETNWLESDAAQLVAAQGILPTPEAVAKICPWRFAPPVSPHAVEENCLIPAEVDAFCREQLAKPGITLIEGAGGIMTPLVQGDTQLDLIGRLGIPVVLVARNYLGAISHTLTALAAAKAAGVRVAAVVLNPSGEGDAPALEGTADAIRRHSPQALRVFTLPWVSPTKEETWKRLPPLLDVINNGR